MEEGHYHIPALLRESIEGLNIHPGGIYIDATMGGGGHSRAILEALGSDSHLYGFDRDMDAGVNAPADPRFTFVHSDFRYLTNFMEYYGVEKVDGVLADLGVSFHHFDTAGRGFSFRNDAPLDMRMNRSGGVTAATLIAESDKEQLETLLRTYTDLSRPGAVAAAIIKRKDHSPILTTTDLVEAVRDTLNPRKEKKELAQIFQSLRIAVNDEMGALKSLLEQCRNAIRPGGRLAVITYHSIEDRIVKNFMRSGNVEGNIDQDIYGRINTPWKLITRSPIIPNEEEIERNPRSRSAKLRIAERKADNSEQQNQR
ncbi:MAG: 16S rRNA (cytosine(1402)-N(4))-methyltransferase RsmH [Candidatus Amulumruptor caecigallinarius]|nr:16S rRNA (cytosine(1402)-N(4))-methyltransferase RsmH [Candidatus Amulumruptor caecigallinarius]